MGASVDLHRLFFCAVFCRTLGDALLLKDKVADQQGDRVNGGFGERFGYVTGRNPLSEFRIRGQPIFVPQPVEVGLRKFGHVHCQFCAQFEFRPDDPFKLDHLVQCPLFATGTVSESRALPIEGVKQKCRREREGRIVQLLRGSAARLASRQVKCA